MPAVLSATAERTLLGGTIIPAHPLVLDPHGGIDERRQRALTRYYLESGAGGIAVGVHTTQFGIRDAGLLPRVLELAAETARSWTADTSTPPLLVAGVAGPTVDAVAEARLAVELGYDLALVILRGLDDLDEAALLVHLEEIGEIIPLCGFALQAAVGGRRLSTAFWRSLASLPALRAIKIAPFDRYDTIDIARAVAESGRAEHIALYTGNDDSILVDLLTEFAFDVRGHTVRTRFVGGLLGQTAVWTRRAVELFERVQRARAVGVIEPELLTLAAQLTDANAAVFDSANRFQGSVAGIHEVLRRQGLLADVHLLDPHESLGSGQADELDRVIAAYPHLIDDAFVADGLGRWLEPEAGKA
jgi:dihydrodipicolinate synthase/N-acetylneuraminate lyase